MFNIQNELIGAEEVFLPNRYSEKFVDAYQEITGLEVPIFAQREQTIVSNGVTYRQTRGRSIPAVVAAMERLKPTVKAVGLTGSEWCVEYDCKERGMSVDWEKFTDRKIGTVSVIAPPGLEASPMLCRSRGNNSLAPVVTALPNFVDTGAAVDRFNFVTAVAVEGGVESVADALGILAVDLVCSGETLQANGFMVVEEILDACVAVVKAIKRV